MAKSKRRNYSTNSLKGIDRNTKVIADYASLQITLFRVGLVVGLIVVLFLLYIAWGGHNLNSVSSNQVISTPSPTSSSTSVDFTKDPAFKNKYLK